MATTTATAPRLYIGGAAIHAFDMDPETGACMPAGAAVEQDGAGSFLVPSADGRRLYALGGDGAVAFAVEPSTGALAHINTVAAGLEGNSHIELCGTDQSVVVLSAYGGGGVSTLSVRGAGGSGSAGSDGGLVEGSSLSVRHGAGSMGDPNRQEASHTHSAFVDPTGGRVLVSDLGTDKIHTYAVVEEAGRQRLQEVSVYEAAVGAGPRHLCFHPDGRRVYSINELDCTIAALSYDPATGQLSGPLAVVSTLPPGYNNHDHAHAKNALGAPASGPNSPPDQTNSCADIHVTPNGRFVYGSNRGHDSLVCFAIGCSSSPPEPEEPPLTLVGWTSTHGEHPRNFGIHPSGRWLVVANQDSANVVVFSCDPETGALTRPAAAAGGGGSGSHEGVHELEVPKCRCVKWLHTAGAAAAGAGAGAIHTKL